MLAKVLCAITVFGVAAEAQLIDLFGARDTRNSIFGALNGRQKRFMTTTCTERKGIAQDCAERIFSVGGIGHTTGVGAFSGLITKNVKLCQGRNEEKGRDIRTWIDMIQRRKFDQLLEDQCAQQICAELRNCEDTMTSMCALTEGGVANLANPMSLLDTLGSLVKGNSARNTAQDACEKMMALARGKTPETGAGDFLSIIQKGVGGQVAGSAIGNAGNSGGGLGNLGGLANLGGILGR